MNTISREDLKAKLDRGENFKLLMTLGDWAYQEAHIPGSLNYSHIEDALANLDKDEEIVVYCSDPSCIASQSAYRMLVKNGFTNVRRYSGGLAEWSAAGYPLEGSSV